MNLQLQCIIKDTKVLLYKTGQAMYV